MSNPPLDPSFANKPSDDSNDGISKRQQALRQWLNQQFADTHYELTSLLGDASFRCYHRLLVGGDKRYIIMDAPPEKESIVEFVAVAELLSAVVNVPDIIAKDMQQGFLLLQDFGQVEFAHLLADADSQTVDRYYQQAMDTLLDLQSLSIQAGQQQDLACGYMLGEYDKDMLLREMALFTQWFVTYVGVSFDETAQQCWQGLTDVVIDAVLQQPQVVVHRDYHSRNLMQDCDNLQQLGVIDFQDAVIGAYSYDLVSLLRDAYVSWTEQQVYQWIEYYWQHMPDALKAHKNLQQFCQDINIMGVQRHLKVLGIFVRLSERDGKTRYLHDIPKVMNDLLIELAWLVKQGDDEAVVQPIAAFESWLKTQVLPAYQQKFADYLG